jgi:protein-S-isoprenylcysteine O-methyltransferase Ste14
MPETPNAGPGIRVIPPLLYLAALAIAFLVDWLWPVAVLAAGLQYAVGGVLIAASLALVLWSVGLFRRAGTPFDVRRPATALVTDGPYRLSRNPGYLSLTGLSLGIAFAADNVWVLPAVGVAAWCLDRFVIRLEERHLNARFGEAYRSYCAQVRRWL